MASSCSSLTLTYRNTTEDPAMHQKSFKLNHNDDSSLLINNRFQQSMSISIDSNSIYNQQTMHSFTNADKNDKFKLQSISVDSNDLTSRTRAALTKGICEFTSNENVKSFKQYSLENRPIDSTFYWLPLTCLDNQFLRTAEK